MKKALLERELLAIIKQLEGDLSSPYSPQGMQRFRSVVGKVSGNRTAINNRNPKKRIGAIPVCV